MISYAVFCFPSRTAFGGQKARFFARFTLEPGCHIYGAPLPERYIATSIEFGGPAVAHQDVTWPEPEMVEIPRAEGDPARIQRLVRDSGDAVIQVPAAGGRIDSVGVLTFSGVQSNRMRASANRYLRSAAHASTFSDFRT